MTSIRRYYLRGVPVFITAVCRQREPLLKTNDAKELLLGTMREVRNETGFAMLGYVILADHFHWLIRPTDGDFSRIMHSVKTRFAHRHKKLFSITDGFTCWQRRFWDHLIRDREDLHRHLDYIHFNPVKHGYTDDPAGYGFSSYAVYLAKGAYPRGWGIREVPRGLEGMELE